MGGAKPAILLTGATNSRELISTFLTTFKFYNLFNKDILRRKKSMSNC
jgi:hypothetical protein